MDISIVSWTSGILIQILVSTGGYQQYRQACILFYNSPPLGGKGIKGSEYKGKKIKEIERRGREGKTNGDGR